MHQHNFGRGSCQQTLLQGELVKIDGVVYVQKFSTCPSILPTSLLHEGTRACSDQFQESHQNHCFGLSHDIKHERSGFLTTLRPCYDCVRQDWGLEFFSLAS